VTRVLRDAGCEVKSLDRRWLVEVKSASGNASERLVETARKHLDTWRVLRPDVEVQGIVPVVNHQMNSHPAERSRNAYSRPEFVESLTVPVTTALQLHHAWRRGDMGVIRGAVVGDTLLTSSTSSYVSAAEAVASDGDVERHQVLDILTLVVDDLSSQRNTPAAQRDTSARRDGTPIRSGKAWRSWRG